MSLYNNIKDKATIITEYYQLYLAPNVAKSDNFFTLKRKMGDNCRFATICNRHVTDILQNGYIKITQRLLMVSVWVLTKKSSKNACVTANTVI